MTNMIPFIFMGLVYSIIMFFIVESLSLKRKKELECVEYDVNKVYVCLEKYNTLQYALIYFILVLIYTVLIAVIDFIPHKLGLEEILVYIFLTSFLGSLYILLFKWRKNLIIKLFSSFLYGSLFMSSSAVAFAISYFFFS